MKLQFFKTFILPYFDYSVSLIVYFSKEAVKKLAKLYYICIYKLLNIDLSKFSTPFEMNAALKYYHLFSFHHRCVFRILSFLFKLKTDLNSPSVLVKMLTFRCDIEHSYNLRKSSLLKVKLASVKTRFGDLIFSNVFGNLLNKLGFDDFDFVAGSYKLYKKKLLERIDTFLRLALNVFQNLNTPQVFFHFFK